MKKTITINQRIKIKPCKSYDQGCIYCGEKIGFRNMGYTFSNKGDRLKLKKNLWLHLRCIDNFSNLLKEEFKKNELQIGIQQLLG